MRLSVGASVLALAVAIVSANVASAYHLSEWKNDAAWSFLPEPSSPSYMEVEWYDSGSGVSGGQPAWYAEAYAIPDEIWNPGTALQQHSRTTVMISALLVQVTMPARQMRFSSGDSMTAMSR